MEPSGFICAPRWWLVLGAAALSLWLAPAGARAATTWTVTTTADQSGGSCTAASCSLRQAVAAAHDGDTVVLPANASHYMITTAGGGPVDVGSAITIRGGGATRSVIDISGGTQGLSVTSAGTVTLSGLIVENASQGAVVSTQTSGFLVVEDCLFTDNTSGRGGAILAAGGLQITDSRFISNTADSGPQGGAVDVGAGDTTITDSTFTDNTATGTNSLGGAIFSQGDLTVTGSTIDHNTASASAGCACGGGIAHEGSAALLITDSTIADNAASSTNPFAGVFGGGLWLADTSIVPDAISSSTIAGNSTVGSSAGVTNGGNLLNGDSTAPQVEGTIIAGGSATGGNADCSGNALDSQGYNLEQLDQCGLDSTTDLPDTDPQLGPLAANGGPTETMALTLNSQAVDHIPASVSTICQGATDQRGVTRPQPTGGMCDVGAYELTQPSCQPVSISTLENHRVTIQLRCSDPDRSAISYGAASSPAHGALGAVNPASGKVTYTPAVGFRGADSFTYYAYDANGSSPRQTVSITVKTPPPPAISDARLTHIRFRVASAATALTAAAVPRGTKFLFTLSETANLKVKFTHLAPGLLSGSSCVTPTERLRQTHAGHCTRRLRAGKLSRASESRGPDRLLFTGRVGERPLSPGHYVATLRAGNANGSSQPATLRFTVIAR